MADSKYTFYTPQGFTRPVRLSEETRKFAYESLDHKYGLDTRKTDAVVLVVSEESGVISIANAGVLKRDLLPDQLEEVLRRLLIADRQDETDFDTEPARDSREGAEK